jgi:thiamine-monophosphate kinase
MGARPVAAFLSLGLPRDLISSRAGQKLWVDRFYDGLLALAGDFEVPLAGGDLAESPVAVADIVLVGAVPKGRALLRSTARPGDALYVTGALGGAAAGLIRLAALAGQQAGSARAVKIPVRLDSILQPHLYPQPRISQGRLLLRRQIATAAIDISDGLSTDLAHLCQESGVAAVLEADAIPSAPGATMEQALHGGEDYELLFAAHPATRVPRSVSSVPITRIGSIVRRRSSNPLVALRTSTGLRALEPSGWEHFSGR